MLPENLTAVVARNESWTGASATEPYEAGWAKEAIVFVRALKEPKGALPKMGAGAQQPKSRLTPEQKRRLREKRLRGK